MEDTCGLENMVVFMLVEIWKLLKIKFNIRIKQRYSFIFENFLDNLQ